MRVIYFILKLAQNFKFYLSGVFFVSIMSALDATVKPYLIKLLIDKAGSNPYDAFLIVGLFGLLHIFITSIWAFSDWLHIKYTPKFRLHIVFRALDVLNYYSISFFQNNLAGSITTKISDLFNMIPNIIFTLNYQFIQFILNILLSLILLGKVHSLFSIYAFCWIVFFLILNYCGLTKITSLAKNYAGAKAQLWGQIADYVSNIINVKLFSAHNLEIKRLGEGGDNFRITAVAQASFLQKFFILQSFLSLIYLGLFLFLLIKLRGSGSITSGDFALVFMLNINILNKLDDVSTQLRDFITNWSAVDKAIEILELPIEIKDLPDAQDISINKGEIIFDKVKFSYKGASPLFQKKSITIKACQKVGLVGYSGSGKSSFISLILRLYDITEGSILIDGHDISSFTQDSLRSNISLIPQDPILFHRSIMDNIRYGRHNASNEEVIEAAKRAQAHDFIMKLSEGYNSLVGERGVKLSGGQRQRIAIARAILKDAPVLILDEATSALDSATENEIQEALSEVMRGKTTIVIAHRLSTLTNMDRILVFEQGRIIEDGSHSELLAKGEVFKKLWDSQICGFIPEKDK